MNYSQLAAGGFSIAQEPAASALPLTSTGNLLGKQIGRSLQAEDQPYEQSAMGQRPVAQLEFPRKLLLGLPWFHNVILIQKLKDLPTCLWYARQTLE